GVGTAIAEAYRGLSGNDLSPGDWQERLFDALAASDLCYRMTEALVRAMALEALSKRLSGELGRAVTEEEILCRLVLGGEARREGRPLLRPVVHDFVRGVGGAVVSFPETDGAPRLWLSAEDRRGTPDESRARLPVMTCSTCGQHYFEHWVQDLEVG